MKKNILLILLLAAAGGSVRADDCCTPCPSVCSDAPCDRIVDVGCEECACKATSHTFFSVRPEWEAGSPERLVMFRRDRMLARDKDSAWKGGLEIALFGGRSTHAGRLANFFTPFCKSVLNVTETDTLTNDILSHHFNIYTNNGNFESNISFAPQRSVVGFGVDYKQAFAEYKDGHYFWWEIAAPIVRVKTSMNLRENVINDGGGINTDFVPPAAFVGEDTGVPQGPVANMTEAFAQSLWNCGRIENCKCDTITRIADIDLRLGYDIVSHDTCYLESYLGILIPTGNKAKNKYVFEPVAGHNKHFGFLMGSNFGYEVWANKEHDKSIRMDVTMHGLFMLKNRQHRLVDLKYKPWSRYMQVYANQAQAAAAFAAGPSDSAVYLQTPGVNVFCQELCVSAGFERTYNVGFILDAGGFEGELGYNFFARSPECVSLKCPWEEGPALKGDCYPDCVEGSVDCTNGIPDVNCDNGGVTNSLRTINNNNNLNGLSFSAENYALNLIHAEDLDLESAAHPAMLVYTAYGSVGYRWDDYEMPWFLGAGGSYEFSRDNTGMNRWLLWAKGGFSF